MTPKLTPDEQIRSAREGFDSGRDFTVAVEEEFAILDPQTLGLVNRFEEVAAGAVGTPLEPHLVGELIAPRSRCARALRDVRRGDGRHGGAAPAARARRALRGPLGATGTHPWSPWQEQRIIDTLHYRRNDEILRYVVWRNNSPWPTSTSGSRAPTARSP